MNRAAWMRRLESYLTLRGFFLTLGAVAVVLLIWFGGPLFALAGWEPLRTPAARVIFLLLLVVILLSCYLWRAKRQRRDNEKLVSEMMAASSKDELLKQEVDTQRDRLCQALALVKKWKPGRFRSACELPWYLIIGAPGSGKSTALLNSGLEFPLKDEMGINSVKGLGGTQYCDWWFTNRALVIDTAGRYTTQESADRRDSRGWNSFLGLLKKYRSRQPINGVILAVSIVDLINQTPTEQALHTRALKQRVQELKNRLGMVFPVYVVLTKFDLLEGFADTFAMLSAQEREEVLGMTFELPAVEDPATLPSSFDQEFDALLDRLSQFLLYRMQQERIPDKRRRIYEFPKQVALLRAPLWSLVKEIFCPSAYEEAPILRGIYLVSAEQSGRTYDRMSDLVDSQFDFRKPGSAPAQAVTQDGFFLRRLFENIVFAEHGLASVNGRKKKRFLWGRRFAFAGMLLSTFGLGGAWYLSYQWNAALVAEYQGALGSLQKDLMQPHQDWVWLDGLLSRAAGLSHESAAPVPEGAPRQLGLSQGEDLRQAAEGAYGRLLQGYFGRDLKDALEFEIANSLTNLEYLYETLKTYLMLNEKRHLDKDQVRAWFGLILSHQLPGQINTVSRESLLSHLEHYLTLDLNLEIDRDLVARARAELTAMPLAERAYQRIKLDASQSPLPDFRLPLLLGSMAELVFERRSGASLTEGIPGLYTQNGYQGVFEPEKNKVVSHLLEDAWVYGEVARDFGDLDEMQVKASVEDRYFRDYIHSWESFLADLRIKSFSSQTEGTRVATLLAGPEAPLDRLMAAVRQNTELSMKPSIGPVLDGSVAALQAGATQRRHELGALMRMIPTNSEPEPTLVGRTFSASNRLEPSLFQSLQADAKLMARYFEEQSEGRPKALAMVGRPQFDQAMKSFYNTVNESGSDVLKQLLDGFFDDARKLVKSSARQKINEIWHSSVYSGYQRAIAGHYPFVREAENDVALMDFANFFGYSGVLDNFFNEHLKAHVDTSRSPWRLTGDVGISQNSLLLFERALRIREAFFALDSRAPRVSFSLKPVYLDSRVTQLLLEVDGQTLVYRHGPARTISFEWPEQTGSQLTRVAFTPGNTADQSVQESYQGAWALFRMLQAAGAMDSGDSRQDIDILLDNYMASLELITDSVRHPFNTAMLERFRLPATL